MGVSLKSEQLHSFEQPLPSYKPHQEDHQACFISDVVERVGLPFLDLAAA